MKWFQHWNQKFCNYICDHVIAVCLTHDSISSTKEEIRAALAYTLVPLKLSYAVFLYNFCSKVYKWYLSLH